MALIQFVICLAFAKTFSGQIPSATQKVAPLPTSQVSSAIGGKTTAGSSHGGLPEFRSQKWDLVELGENSLLRAFSLPSAVALIRQRNSDEARFEVVSTQSEIAHSSRSCRRILKKLTAVLADSVEIAKTQMHKRRGRVVCEAELKSQGNSERMKFVLFPSGHQGYALLSNLDEQGSSQVEKDLQEVLSSFK